MARPLNLTPLQAYRRRWQVHPARPTSGRGAVTMASLIAPLGRLIVAGMIATTGVIAGASAVAAADPGPVQHPFTILRDPGPVNCPLGLEVALNAPVGTTLAPGVATFIPPVTTDPGPVQCAPGVTVLADPGPMQTPGVVAQLPLNAADCAAGTASLQATADALGLVVAPPDPASGPGPTGCASGDVLTVALVAVIAAGDPGPIQCPDGIAVGVNPGPIGRLSPGTLVLADPGPIQCPVGTGLLLLPAVQGLVRGALVLRDPGPTQHVFRIVPAGIAGLGSIR